MEKLTIEEIKNRMNATQAQYKELSEMLATQEKEEKEKKEAELAANKQAKYDEIKAKYTELSALIKQYINDYGNIHIEDKNGYNIFTPFFGRYIF